MDEILGRGFASLERLFDSEKQKIAEGKAEISVLDEKIRNKLTAFLEIVTFYNKQGINIVDLIKEQINPEKQGGIIPYEGPERRKYWPYTPEEQLYHDKLQAILKGKNKKNALAIKQNIDAFYDTREVENPLEVKKAEGA